MTIEKVIRNKFKKKYQGEDNIKSGIVMYAIYKYPSYEDDFDKGNPFVKDGALTADNVIKTMWGKSDDLDRFNNSHLAYAMFFDLNEREIYETLTEEERHIKIGDQGDSKHLSSCWDKIEELCCKVFDIKKEELCCEYEKIKEKEFEKAKEKK